MKIRTRVSLVQLGLLLLVSTVLVVGVHRAMRGQAPEEARAKARLILDHNLAVHTYFTHDLRPAVSDEASVALAPNHFDPVWMSSTYAVRAIHGYFLTLSPVPYYYKESAIGARSPLNEADGYERTFLDELNRDSELVERAAVREIDGDLLFQVLRRGESMGASCLRCHTDPAIAPGEMVREYGPDRSFGREEGEVVSAISVRIPLGTAYASADAFALKLSAVLVALLAAFLGANTLLWNHWLVRPLDAVRSTARRISGGSEHLGELMEEPSGEEMRELVQAINLMSTSLRRNQDELEDRVRERTKELQDALENVKTLSGLLPICARCKKIRDDGGYWEHLESYLSRHSDVLFSHGVCPECAEEIYGDFMRGDPDADDQEP